MDVHDKRSIPVFLTALIIVCALGCVSVPQPADRAYAERAVTGTVLREDAFAVYHSAGNADEVMYAIELLEQLSLQSPGDLEVLVRLSNLYIFKGAALETGMRAAGEALQ